MKDLLPKDRHQIVALLLYVVFIAIIKLTWIPLAALFAAHCCEYIAISSKLAREKSIPQLNAALHTILYGFTWWKPIKEKK